MPWYSVKVIGDKGVGKSSLVRRFLLGEFGEDYPGGRPIFWEKASLPCVDNNKYYNHGLIVWDGDPQTVNAPDIELGDDVIGEAVVVVYDVTNPSSFYEAMTQVEYYTKYGMSGSLHFVDPLVVGLVGSKADLLMDKERKYEGAQRFAQRHGILFMEVSAFTGMNVHNLFSKIGMMVQSRAFFWNWSVNRRPAFIRSMCKLDLSHSQLYELPEAIGFLPSLTHLFLNDNHLSLLQPEIIRRLVNLQELDLRNNQLEDFSLDITELSCLQRLCVQGNPLKNDETRKLMKLANNERWIDIAGECKIL